MTYEERKRVVSRRALSATVIANAQAREELRRLRAELTASQARIAAAADQARRQIERDLHDGAQQQLVALALRLRMAQTAVPPGGRDCYSQPLSRRPGGGAPPIPPGQSAERPGSCTPAELLNGKPFPGLELLQQAH